MSKLNFEFMENILRFFGLQGLEQSLMCGLASASPRTPSWQGKISPRALKLFWQMEKNEWARWKFSFPNGTMTHLQTALPAPRVYLSWCLTNLKVEQLKINSIICKGGHIKAQPIWLWVLFTSLNCARVFSLLPSKLMSGLRMGLVSLCGSE